jgi:hypothetical protein
VSTMVHQDTGQRLNVGSFQQPPTCSISIKRSRKRCAPPPAATMARTLRSDAGQPSRSRIDQAVSCSRCVGDDMNHMDSSPGRPSRLPADGSLALEESASQPVQKARAGCEVEFVSVTLLSGSLALANAIFASVPPMSSPIRDWKACRRATASRRDCNPMRRGESGSTRRRSLTHSTAVDRQTLIAATYTASRLINALSVQLTLMALGPIGVPRTMNKFPR